MRVYDFGWVEAERGWGKGGRSEIRLQMHATDPVYLEPRLGQAASKGCVRIPAALNRIVDAFGLLDADYLDAVARGDALWVLRRDRTPVSFPAAIWSSWTRHARCPGPLPYGARHHAAWPARRPICNETASNPARRR